eukprot:TRINITY_DN74051_c0_g1_i1.p1 TRINITY_DN74051_c0_g1~~TRINITY_DN74051_c0_g1_i1.p1  ORF type:complete len:922 (-),score=163.59 TRINITY_DN74051_c0_g1_i1:140-2905(-)
MMVKLHTPDEKEKEILFDDVLKGEVQLPGNVAEPPMLMVPHMSERSCDSGNPGNSGNSGIHLSPRQRRERRIPTFLRGTTGIDEASDELKRVGGLQSTLRSIYHHIDKHGQIPNEHYTLTYKGREVQGLALHAAACHPEGAQLVRMLIELRADVSSSFTYKHALGKIASSQAIHMAAAYGNVQVLQELLGARADVEARADLDNEMHYLPIHNAVFTKQAQAVEFLLANFADVNAQNKHGWSPLHLAADSSESIPLVNTLIRYSASLNIQDHKGQTPLMVAVESDKYPHEELHRLAAKHIDSVVMVAERSRFAAADLMKDHAAEVGSTRTVREEWRETLGDVGLSNWLRLMKLAPEAAEDVLEALTISPPVEDPVRHPMPRRAHFRLSESVRCYYCDERSWTYSANAVDGKTYPDWHNTLAPRRSIREDIHATTADADEVEVCLRQVNLPGVISSRVLHVLATSRNDSIFAKLPTQAILEFTWHHVVKSMYYSKVFLRLLVVIVFMVPLSDASERVRRYIWSFTCFVALRDLLCDIFHIYGHIWLFREPFENLMFSRKFVVDMAMGSMQLVICYSTMDQMDFLAWPRMFAIQCYFRWWRLLYSLRVFPQFGTRLLPILQSFRAMGPMTILAGFLVLGFYHACLVLRKNALRFRAEEVDCIGFDDCTWLVTLSEVFRLFVMTDGEVYAPMLAIHGSQSAPGGGSEDYVLAIAVSVSVFMLCVFILNLFIAVHGEAYDIAQERAKAAFSQDRAGVCLDGLLQPCWQGRYISRPYSAVALVVLLTLVSVAFLLEVPNSRATLFSASTLLLGCGVMTDAILLQRPWRETGASGEKHVLWICFRKSWHESQDFTGLGGNNHLGNIEGRLSSLRNEAKLNFKNMNHTLQALYQMNQTQAARDRHHQATLDTMMDRLNLLEELYEQRDQ